MNEPREPSSEVRAAAAAISQSALDNHWMSIEGWNEIKPSLDKAIAAALEAKERERISLEWELAQREAHVKSQQQEIERLTNYLRDVRGAYSVAKQERDTLAQQLAVETAEVETLRKAVEDWKVSHSKAEQQLEALRMVVVKWQGSCRSTKQVEETDECIAAWNKRAADAEQQLEQAVRLGDGLMAQLPHCRRCAEDFREQEIRGCPYCDAKLAMSDFLSSPAIAPIVAKISKKP